MKRDSLLDLIYFIWHLTSKGLNYMNKSSLKKNTLGATIAFLLYVRLSKTPMLIKLEGANLIKYLFNLESKSIDHHVGRYCRCQFDFRRFIVLSYFIHYVGRQYNNIHCTSIFKRDSFSLSTDILLDYLVVFTSMAAIIECSL